jgi:putative restriction endonuclease
VHERFGQPTVVYPRLGQGSFRVLVTDIYDRRCAITGERTLPVLDAAHIKPFRLDGPHDPRNGLLLRSDLHTLFDRGYVTVTPDLRLQVSRRIREKFENGREYYKYNDQIIRPPKRADLAPARDYLDWHANNVFRG